MRVSTACHSSSGRLQGPGGKEANRVAAFFRARTRMTTNMTVMSPPAKSTAWFPMIAPTMSARAAPTTGMMASLGPRYACSRTCASCVARFACTNASSSGLSARLVSSTR